MNGMVRVAENGAEIPFQYEKGGNNEEEQFWKPAGKVIAGLPASIYPASIAVFDEDGREAVVEGKVKPDSDEVGFRIKSNQIYLDKGVYQPVLMRLVDPETNRHSYYDFIPNTMGEITCDIGARFGKIGQKGMDLIEDGNVLKSPFPTELFWIKVYQKINEGYTDETESLLDESDPVEALFQSELELPKEDEDDAAVQLYEKLSTAAMDCLADFNIDWLSNKAPYNGTQINACWKRLQKLSDAGDELTADTVVKAANEAIEELIKIASPNFEKGQSVKSFLIPEQSDVNKAKSLVSDKVTEWENRIMAMEAVSSKNFSKEKKTVKQSPFGNIAVRKATKEEFDKYVTLCKRGHCSGDDYKLVKNVYLIDPVERRETYEKYLATAEDKSEMDLFHGTVTGNLVSIISSGGPTIHVQHANGTAFGSGSYFATDMEKSLGYTSWTNSRYGHGNADHAFMCVCKVHTGKCYYPVGVEGEQARKKTLSGGYDCCFASAKNSGFYMDELITYDEEHSYLEAILELGGEEDMEEAD